LLTIQLTTIFFTKKK